MASGSRPQTGVLYRDDNLQRLPVLPDECVDLVYLDPPFFSERNYQVVWGDEAEVRAFEDRWEGGLEVYVGWVEERVREVRRVLKPSGSVYLHCDWHASHYLKVMMDGVLGRENFLNSIVWCYGLGGSSHRYWPRKHDDLLFYSKTPDGHVFEADRVPATSQRMKGRSKKAPDHWDLPAINNMARERLGYPTQKPLELLRRIVRSSSRAGDVVLDPFAGCGTTLAAAEELGREWIGIDISPTAVEVTRSRLARLGARPRLVGMPATAAQVGELAPLEFRNWVAGRMRATQVAEGGGVDGLTSQGDPIRWLQAELVDGHAVSGLCAAVERAGRARGVVVALSFAAGAYEEAARVHAAHGPRIDLVEVGDLLVEDCPPDEGGQNPP